VILGLYIAWRIARRLGVLLLVAIVAASAVALSHHSHQLTIPRAVRPEITQLRHQVSRELQRALAPPREQAKRR
jgi:hypothetical protein